MAIPRSVLSAARSCAALALTTFLIAGCGSIQLSPGQATTLHDDKMIVFGRVQVVENGQAQTAALDTGFRPKVFFLSQDRTPKLFKDEYFIETDADGYFFAVVPARSYALRLYLHSQFTKFNKEVHYFPVYPGVQLPPAAPGAAHYVGTLRIESQITGKKGVYFSGPKVCRLVSAGILDEFAVAENEFRRRFPLDANLGMSKALLEQNSELSQGMFYDVERTTSGEMLEGPATLLLWPVLVVMSPAIYQDNQQTWKGPDQECRLYDSSRPPSLWQQEAEPSPKQPKQ